MLSDLRNPKSKRNINTVNKSSTAVSLPGISSAMKYCQTDRKPNKQSYMETINHISENVEYGDKNTLYLTKEQSKLKQMLKKMNNDTLHMIDLIRPKKLANKISKEEITLIADRQLDNSKKNISILQCQIEMLEAKYSKIVEHSQEQELVNKIREVKADIELIKNGNTDIKFNIEKDGKEIVKEYSDGYDAKLTILENDNVLYDQKLEKLKVQNNKTIEEISKLQLKLKDADEKIETHDEQYQKVKSHLHSQTMSRNMEATIKERKYQAETIKKKMEFQNGHLQYKYYKLLKQLEAKKGVCDDLLIKEEDIIKKISKSKQEILHFQALYERLRKQKQQKNRSVLLFLQKQRKNREQTSQMRDSMVMSNIYASRQQLMPHAMSLREPMQKTLNEKQEQDETRKWQTQTHEQINENLTQPIDHKQNIKIEEKQQQKSKKEASHMTKKEDSGFSTAQLKQKQHSPTINTESLIATGEKEHSNPL